MTNPLNEKNLTRNKLQQIMEAVKEHIPQEELQPVEADPYEWHRPYHFSLDQLAKLEAFGKHVESNLTKTFVGLCQDEFEAKITSITQHFARFLADSVDTDYQNHYFLPFVTDSAKQCGYICLSSKTSLELIRHMLRESEAAAEQERELSELEESILTDTLSVIIETFAAVLQENAAPAIKPLAQLVKGTWPLDHAELEDFCSIDFNVQSPDGAIEATVTLAANIIEPVVGITPEKGPKPTKQHISDAIMHQLQDASVEVTAQLTYSLICLQDVMNLQQQDIILLDKKTYEPIDVLLNKRPSMKAHPVTSSNKHAILITKQISQ